jgi:2-hydroxy-6-oxonona-2,4-dienedioate hydrolase
MDEARYRQAEQRLWASVGLVPAEHHVRLASTGTLVRVQSVGEGEPALFIHGGPNSGSTWAPLLEHLQGFRCLLVDRPGTGLSQPYPVTLDNLPGFGATFVGDVLTGMGIDRAHVVASSFGGHLALRSAAAHPERFLRMVQMACPALSPGEQEPPFLRLLKIGLFRKILNVLPPNARANRAIMRQLGHAKSLDNGQILHGFLEWYIELQRHTDTNRNDAAMIGRVLPERASLTLTRELLASAGVPTMFLWGADDTFGGPDVARHMVSCMPEADLVLIPDAGHLPWLDDPRHVAELTRAFLAGPTLPSPSPEAASYASPAHRSPERAPHTTRVQHEAEHERRPI